MISTSIRISLAAVSAAAILMAADLSDAAKERFLREAKVVAAKELSVGVTHSKRLTLSDGTFTHDAQFQDIDEFKPLFQGARGTEANFRDSYRYNIAAYRLDRLLGLDMTPTSIERKYAGDLGALTWWVDDVQMMELERWKKHLTPPDKEAWNNQMFQARLFNELIYNTDANLGNVLIDKDWRIWLVDFTRAFRLYKKLKSPESLGRVDRRLWENLQKLDEATLTKAMDGVLFKAEITALLARRDEIVRLVQERIEREGEATVLIDLPREDQ